MALPGLEGGAELHVERAGASRLRLRELLTRVGEGRSASLRRLRALVPAAPQPRLGAHPLGHGPGQAKGSRGRQRAAGRRGGS